MNGGIGESKAPWKPGGSGGDKWEKLNDLDTSLMDKNNEENNRTLDAKDYLESQGKLSDSVELYNKINDRWLKINKYREGRYFELNKTLKEEEKKETKRVKEKAQEMEDQYSR